MMKNTLKIVLFLIGLGFLSYSLYSIFTIQHGDPETRRQLFGMLGVGVLFLVAGAAMGKR